MGVAVCASQVLFASPSSSGGLILALFPCSSVGSLPRETGLHEPLQHESFSWATVLQVLFQHWFFPRGAVFREHTALVWVSHWVTTPASKSAPVWAPSVHRSCQEPASVWALCGVTVSFGHSPGPVWCPPQAVGGYLLHCGPPRATGGQSASPRSSPQAAGECLQHLLLLLLHIPWCLQGYFSRMFSLLYPEAVFFTFLNMSSQRSFHYC